MSLVFYQIGGFFGYSIGDVLNRWADLGVFAYVLPFLMIFALVYGILVKTAILGAENKGVNATIALAFGLLALQFDYVSGFYASIFPYAGMGLAVLLIGMILMGLMSDNTTGMGNKIWFGIGIVIFVVVLFGSLGDTYWIGGFGGFGVGLREAAPALLAIIIVLGILGGIVWGGGK
jgi:hypothetical protein